MTPGTVRLRAHAKINLFLRIAGRRADGYHDIESVVVPLELHDVVRIGPADGQLTVEADRDDVPDGDGNICHRAALAFDRATGVTSAAAVSIHKRIPSAAGLGGGSADAAATLVGLNELHGEPLPATDLQRLAGTVGADVPLFLAEGPALIEGLGERVTPLTQGGPLDIVLAKPAVGMGTAEAYALADAYWQLCPFPVADTVSALATGGPERVAFALHNDFWEPVGERHAELVAIRAALIASGALGASLTGSGTCVFGIFPDEASAGRAEGAMAGRAHWVVRTRTAARGVELVAEEHD